ncbi:MAG TPA: acyl-CoA dehydrogenase family protein, partial [Novosphingobium sp.]
MSDDTHLEDLRRDVRGWLETNAPKNWRETYPTLSHQGFAQAQRDWFHTLAKGGYAVPHWPAEWPGGGRSLAEQKVIYEELARADTPRLLLSFVSTYHAASTLLECGNAQQKAKYLPKILEGETWCQGFSEPNAGSDLAAIKTRAERKGDVYVVNG